MHHILSVDNLQVSIQGKQVLNGIDLSVAPNQVHALMGPNGSGKSSFALSLMGHPGYEYQQGRIVFKGQEIHELSPDKRAKLGIFLALQHPYEIEGVTYKDFLRQTYNALYDGTGQQMRIRDFHAMLLEKLKLLKMDESFIHRSVNVGFSGGEKKRAEMLQLAVLKPKLVILDEIDSGLDIDALKTVCDAFMRIKEENPDMAVIIITHYHRILDYLKPDFVHIMDNGKIVNSGSHLLAYELERTGYLSTQP